MVAETGRAGLSSHLVLKYTALEPASPESAHVFEVPYASQEEYVIPSFEKHISVAPVADKVNETELVVVSVAPPLIVMVCPVGAGISNTFIALL